MTPLLSTAESEILGILFGDGSMSKYRNSVHIAISGHKYEDREYLVDRVRPMFAGLFGILLNVRYVKNENSMMIYASNSAIAMTLNEWGMPYGRKKLSRLVPTVRLDETCFVRGIFDTDGCVYRKYGEYMQVQFKSASPSLMRYLKRCLLRLGFHPTAITPDDTKFRFFLSRQAEVTRFFRTIEPRNSKHIKRFQKISVGSPFHP